MIVAMAAINVSLSQNKRDNGLSVISLANVEALTTESDWIEGYRTGSIKVNKQEISCCVSSVFTDSCDYGVIGSPVLLIQSNYLMLFKWYHKKGLKLSLLSLFFN